MNTWHQWAPRSIRKQIPVSAGWPQIKVSKPLPLARKCSPRIRLGFYTRLANAGRLSLFDGSIVVTWPLPYLDGPARAHYPALYR